MKLYVYDISRGFARQLSPLLLGKLFAFNDLWQFEILEHDSLTVTQQ